MISKRYSALGWVVWKVSNRVVRRKAARSRAKLTAAGVALGVVAAGAAAAKVTRGGDDSAA